ncbi:ATP-dependent DNA helicase PIF1-like [Physella acuta]|uniref:ATP-dependent DNA helicase PIF1-like n=1 Tax=Physella acuta TaxID=109671 RepID=UPI0027DB1160|nr:ATP-dependent DNA helicase PIF1-like [Physella acuta]
MCLYCENCENTDASNLWNQHRARLKDFVLRHGHPAEADCDMCDSFGLNKIEEILIGQEKRCKNYHLPTPNPNHVGQMNEYIDREQESMLGQEMEANLNEKQRAAFDAVMEAVNDHTIRSKFTATSTEAGKIRKAVGTLMNEASMCPSLAAECINKLYEDITISNIAFGGKVFLAGGDFRQCLPVVPGAEPAEVVLASLKHSKLWDEFKILKLDLNVRSVDPEYNNWLLKLGNGELGNDFDLGRDIIEIPEQMIESEDIVKTIYGTCLKHEHMELFYGIGILCPKNEDVDSINQKVLDLLEGEEKAYLSFDSLVSDELKLKVGAIIMLLRNLNTNQGLCNGSRLVVTKMMRNVVEAKVITGKVKGNIVLIPRSDLKTDSGLPFELKRRPFPLKLAFAMTINKSQGQTLDKVGLYLSTPVFGHGQLYVAFSRARRSADVKVFVKDSDEQGKLVTGSEKVFTRNVV